MDLLSIIENKESEDFGDCTKCENFLPFEEPKCDIYGEPNCGISVCPDFRLSEFWERKRGY